MSYLLPIFLKFCVSSQYRQASLIYRQCKLKLLQEEIRHKKSDIRVLKKILILTIPHYNMKLLALLNLLM